jgi:hypothetical protein
MRQSERDARIAAVAEARFGSARHVLAIGSSTQLDGRERTQVDSLASALTSPGRFDALLWQLASDTSAVRTGLAGLRAQLSPSAALLLIAPKRAPLFGQLRAALAGETPKRASLPPLCGALLRSGFLSPRVHDDVPGWLLVSARLAPAADPLDAFFEQPLVSADR